MSSLQRPLQDILWHNPRDCFAWEKEGSAILSSELAEEYSRWLNSALGKDVLRSLCFLDVTLSNIDRTELFGVIMAPDENCRETYRNTVVKVNTFSGKSRTVGSHYVFQAGLPVFNRNFGKDRSPQEDIRPQTAEELNKCLGDALFVVSDSYLSWTDESVNRPRKRTAKSLQKKPSLLAKQVFKEDCGYPKDPVLYKKLVQKASEYQVQKNWEIFIKFLQER